MHLKRRNILLLALFLSMNLAPALVWSAKNYKSVLKEWTRNDEAYNWNNFEARLVWSATYLSDTFRRAKVDKYAQIYELDQAERASLLRKEEVDSQKYDTFFVAIYAGSREYPDIGKNRSLWKLVLKTPDHKSVPPTVWEEVPGNQVNRALYPYIDRWSRTFLVKFPKVITGDTEQAQLKMVGVPANSSLTWDLAKLRKISQ